MIALAQTALAAAPPEVGGVARSLPPDDGGMHDLLSLATGIGIVAVLFLTPVLLAFRRRP